MSSIIHWLCIITTQILGVTVGVCCAAAAPATRLVPESARTIVERFAGVLAPFAHVAYTANIRATKTVNGAAFHAGSEYGVSEDEHGRGIFQMFYRRDHDRLDILQLKEGTGPGAEAWASAEQHLFRVVVDNSPTIFTYSDFVERRVDRRTPRGIRFRFGPAAGGVHLGWAGAGRHPPRPR